MKVVVTRKSMIQALYVGGSMAGRSKTLPILNCVKVTVKAGSMTISSFDGQNSITKIFNIDNSEGDVCFCVDCKDLSSLLKSLRDEQVELDVDDFNLRIIHKKGVQTLPLENADEYPQPNRDKMDDSFTMEAGTLYEMVNTAKNFIQPNDLKPQMASVFIGVSHERIDFAATDGFTLFADHVDYTFEGEERQATINMNAVIPLLDMIATALDVKISIGERNMSFRTEDAMLVSTMSEHKYPNYKAIIPTNHTIEVNIDKEEMLDTLSRVMLTANKENCLIKLSTEGMNLNVVSEDLNFSKKSKEALLCEKSGEDITIGVKGTYLKTCIDQVTAEHLSMYMTHCTRPIVLKDDNFASRVIMLMPMAI